MPHTNRKRHLTQELSKQYLNGELSPREMYLVEDLLLENDFYFEAMEGLERMPWERCERAVDQTLETISHNFKIKPRTNWKRNGIMLAAVALIAAGLGTIWFFDSKSPHTLDLTSESRSAGPDEPLEETLMPKIPSEEDQLSADSSSEQTSRDNQQDLSTTPLEESDTETFPAPADKPVLTSHVAVGRIVDIRGEALNNIMVSVDGISDSTDKSGYYALRIPPGTTKMTLRHPAFSLEVEIDTSENWEIVLDVDQRQIIEKYPINAANRFK